MKKLLVLAVLLLAGAGCTKGTIHADAIDGLVEKISERHDAMLDGTLDPKTISEADKATFKRSTALIREIIQAAKK